MNAKTSFCPMCAHCQLKKELEKELEIAECEREERELKERLAEERRRERVAAKKLVEQGVKHGDNFDAYTVEDIRNITNYEFLEKLYLNIIPCGQPPNDYEYEHLNERIKAVNERLLEVLIDDIE